MRGRPETEQEQQRKIRHRLAVLAHAEEVTGNVARTCRYYGISRPTFYNWRNRYKELGEEASQARQYAQEIGEQLRSIEPVLTEWSARAEIARPSAPIISVLEHDRWSPRRAAPGIARHHDRDLPMRPFDRSG